jgi:hypothetical protein
VSAHPLPRAAAFAVHEPPLSFSMDRILARGPSAAWLDWERPMPQVHRPPWRSASITGFIEHG